MIYPSAVLLGLALFGIGVVGVLAIVVRQRWSAAGRTPSSRLTFGFASLGGLGVVLCTGSVAAFLAVAIAEASRT